MRFGLFTRDLLIWIANGSHSYDEGKEARRTSSPRFPICEDAIDDGLIAVRSNGSCQRGATVQVTSHGLALLSEDR